MSERHCSCAPREGTVLSVARQGRMALWWFLVSDLTAIGDIQVELNKGQIATALRLRQRFEADLRLLDDLELAKNTDQQRFEITMPHSRLRPLLERVYWQSVADLADGPANLTEEAREYLAIIVEMCPGLLAQIAEAGSEWGAAVSAVDTSELVDNLARIASWLERGEQG